MHHLGKQLEFPHHELERSDLLSGLPLGLGFGFQPGRPAAQLSETRLELRLLDQALRVAVDQPLDGAVRLRQLTAESIEFELVRGGLDRIQAALILVDDPCRVVEQPANLAPDRLIEPIDRTSPPAILLSGRRLLPVRVAFCQPRTLRPFRPDSDSVNINGTSLSVFQRSMTTVSGRAGGPSAMEELGPIRSLPRFGDGARTC